MWAKNLLFLGLIGGGFATLAGTLYPPKIPFRQERVDATPPAARTLDPVVREINRSFRQNWSGQGLTPAGKADDLAVARRLSLALTGTIPSLEEIRQFEGRGPDERLEWWLDHLLADRRFADYWAERFARAFVGTEDGPFIVYRRRRFAAWLSDELMKNRPYDELVRELIAGQGLWTDKPATNFITVTIEPEKNGPNPERLGARVARVFLGVRLDCAQCHNHPFQPWRHEDFHALAAYFGPAKQGFTGIYDGDGVYKYQNKRSGKQEPIKPAVPFQPELLVKEETSRGQLAQWVTDKKNPLLGRATANRVWALIYGHPLLGEVDNLPFKGEMPWVVDLMTPINRAWADFFGQPAFTGLDDLVTRIKVLNFLAKDLTENAFDLKRLIRNIAATEVFQLDSALEPEPTARHEQALAVFPLSRLRPEQVVNGIMQAASLTTIDQDSHILVRIIRTFSEKDFVQRYGDTGEDEFHVRSGTIPQQLLLMNGKLVQEQIKDGLFNATTRISNLAPSDQKAVEVAYLTVLTRRPTPAEARHFETRLAGSKGAERGRHLTDFFWTLFLATEFSWNH